MYETIDVFLETCVDTELSGALRIAAVPRDTRYPDAIAYLVARMPAAGFIFAAEGINMLTFWGEAYLETVHAQFSHRWDPKTRESTIHPDWDTSMLVIAAQQETHPLAVQISQPHLPVFAGIQGELDYRIAPSFEAFCKSLMQMRVMAEPLQPDIVRQAVRPIIGADCSDRFCAYFFN